MNQQLGCHCYNRCHLSVSEIDVEKGMDMFSKVVDQFGEEHHKKSRVLSTWSSSQRKLFRESCSEKPVKMQNRLMRSLVIFPAAQEQQEWSYLASGVTSTAAVRSHNSTRTKKTSRSKLNHR